jgi:ribosomal protein S18 acetylase RimI-like enzyme
MKEEGQVVSLSNPSGFRIRDMLESDVAEVVDIHLRSFQDFFLSFLGPFFLKQFYSNMVDSPYGVALVIVGPDKLAGFACGSDRISGFYHDLIRTKWMQLSLAALPAVIRRPSTAIRLMRATFIKPKWEHEIEAPGELSSIAVHPDWEDRGLGRALLTVFMEKLRSRGKTELTLITDRDNNERVNAFYLHSGFRLAGEERTPEGRRLNRYTINL